MIDAPTFGAVIIRYTILFYSQHLSPNVTHEGNAKCSIRCVLFSEDVNSHNTNSDDLRRNATMGTRENPKLNRITRLTENSFTATPKSFIPKAHLGRTCNLLDEKIVHR